MADAAARREARRRKILENSSNRLKLITGETSELTNDVQIVNNDSTIIEEKVPQQQQQQIENFLINTIKCHHETLNNELSEQQQQQPQVDDSAQSSNTIPYSKQVLIIFLAIIIRLLFIFQMQFCVRDSIIYPFIIAEVTLQFLNKNDSNGMANPLLMTVLLLSSLPPVQINRFNRVLRFLETFVQDFSLYFITFLSVHLCLGVFI